MRNKIKGPRGAAIVFLCIALAAMWLIAVYGTYEDSKREKYEVRITPGAVSYGTHSTALMPMAVAPARTSVPMVSAGEVRSYAHYGHASAPAAASNKGLYSTSSAKVKTIGSGGMASGSGMMMTTTPSSSSRGINYTTASVSVPMLAVNSSMMTTSQNTQALSQETATRFSIGPRRIKPNGDGEYHGEPNGSGQYWDENEGEWTGLFVGAIKIEGGKVYRCTNVSPEQWEYVRDQEEPGSPVGETPWIIMILLACAYALTTLYRKYKKTA